MLHVKEVIVVEGRYDRRALSSVVEATVLETSGFAVFNDGQKQKLLRRLAETRGIIILTDPDGAGFVIRRFLRSCIPSGKVKNAYIPEIAGKEKRKTRPSREGKLGVEGMRSEVLLSALKRAGATFDDGVEYREHEPITKADLYRLGLSGGVNSAKKRRTLASKLELPERMGTNALLDVLNAVITIKELKELIAETEE